MLSFSSTSFSAQKLQEFVFTVENLQAYKVQQNPDMIQLGERIMTNVEYNINKTTQPLTKTATSGSDSATRFLS